MTNINNSTIGAGMLPTIYSKAVIVEFDKAVKLNRIVDFSWGSELVYGTTVRVPTLASLSTVSKLPGVRLTPIANNENYTDIVVNKFETVPLMIEEISVLQSQIDLLGKYAKQSAEAIARKFDADIAAEYVNAGDSVDATSTGATIAKISELRLKFDEGNIPEDGQDFLVLSAKAYNQLKADMRALNYAVGNLTPELIAMGVVAEVEGFNIIKSNQVVKTTTDLVTTYQNFACHRSAIAAIIQKDTTVTMQFENLDQATSLVTKKIYGIKTVRPEALFSFPTR